MTETELMLIAVPYAILSLPLNASFPRLPEGGILLTVPEA